MRKKIIAGNWKMNKTVEEAVQLASAIKVNLAACKEVDVVLCPPFTALKSVSEVVSESLISVGAQNMSSEENGAYTGEISHAMLKELFVRYVILGHSERREYYKETDFWINKKVKKALEKNLRPILCVGEKLADREAGHTEKVVEVQVREGLKDVPASAYNELVIAYEPVWAIGTGKTATSDDAQAVCAAIRGKIRDLADDATADAVRIQYGGSVKASNATELMAQPDIDGALVGGASLDPDEFAKIVQFGS